MASKPNPARTAPDASPQPTAVATVIDVLADGFQLKREAITRSVESDPEIRAKVHALATGRGTEDTVEDVHALLKQRLLYER